MNIEHSINEYADWIGEVLRFTMVETDDSFIYTPVRFDDCSGIVNLVT